MAKVAKQLAPEPALQRYLHLPEIGELAAAQGRVVLDVSGKEREGLDVHHLLEMFEKVRGEKLDDDALLLG